MWVYENKHCTSVKVQLKPFNVISSFFLGCLFFPPSLALMLFTAWETTTQRNIYDLVSPEDQEEWTPSDIPSKSSPSLEKRRNIVMEIINTEKAYFDSLNVVKEVFIKALFSKQDSKTSVLTKTEMQIIFINWKDLYGQSNRLFRALKIRQKMSTKSDLNIGDILCEHVRWLMSIKSWPYFQTCKAKIFSYECSESAVAPP